MRGEFGEAMVVPVEKKEGIINKAKPAEILDSGSTEQEGSNGIEVKKRNNQEFWISPVDEIEHQVG